MGLALCWAVLHPAPGRCEADAASGECQGKSPSRGAGPAIPTRAENASAASRPDATAGVGGVDVPGDFARLGPDASLWYQHVETLASPAFEGRAPGTRGIELAAEYIEFYLRAYSLKPAFPDATGSLAGTASRSYEQPMTVDGALPDGFEKAGTLEIAGKRLVAGKDFVVTSNARKGIARGTVSFVGYGIESGKDGYSSFDRDTDLHGRVALLFRLEPLDENGDFLWGAQPARHASLATKLSAVASRGAVGILVVNPPGAKVPLQALDPLPAMAGEAVALPAVPTAMITPTAADRLLELADPKARDLMTLRRLADRGDVGTVDLAPSVAVSLETRTEAKRVTTENVAGGLPGRGRLKDEWIVIGGHYDHLGNGRRRTSSHGDAATLLGADDNASGTAAVLVLAKRLAAAYRKAPEGADLRSLLFVAFTAEERGLVGSRQFVKSPPVPLRRIHAMLNLDMVGRLREDALSLSGYDTGVQFRDLLGGLLAESGLRVATEPGSDGSDQVSFLEAGIPALYAMTGGHDELHSPADLAGSMNPAGAVRVVDLVEKIAMRLAEHPGALTFAAQPGTGGSICSAQRPTASKTTGASSVNDEPRALPDNLSGRCVTAFFEAFNSGDDDRARDFERRCRAAFATRSLEERVALLNQIRADLGTLTLLRVLSAGETEISVLALSSSTGERMTLTFQLEDQDPHGMIALRIGPPLSAETEASLAQPIDGAFRKDTIQKIGDALREGYVYPEIGDRMATVLAKNESEGRYDAITGADELAQRLTKDLFDVAKDRHLSVVLYTGPAPAGACGGGAGDASRDNYGFRKSEVLPGNVGYVRFDMFQGSEEAKGAAAAAMASVANADALIFDLRQNVGGSPKMIQFISSYLFDKPTHLVSFFDRLDNKTAETWTLETVPGKRFRAGLPVYVLTSGSTASAAEEFAYDLKNLGRATIVGDTTAGAAHPVTERTINDRFLVRVPYLRAFNPVTQRDWEGVGVVPDIKVPASEALDAALKDATSKLSARRHAKTPTSPGAQGR